MELVFDDCAIRSWRFGDEEVLAQQANDIRIWRNVRDRFPHPYTLADAKAWVRFASASWPETAFAIVVEDQVAGAIGVELQQDVYRRSAEIGYWLGRSFWGRGIATQAVRGFSEYALGSFDLCRLFAGVFENNPASARVLEKAGYTFEGRMRRAVTKEGKTLDQLLYALVVPR